VKEGREVEGQRVGEMGCEEGGVVVWDQSRRRGQGKKGVGQGGDQARFPKWFLPLVVCRGFYPRRRKVASVLELAWAWQPCEERRPWRTWLCDSEKKRGWDPEQG
jgi:hypothetical protein